MGVLTEAQKIQKYFGPALVRAVKNGVQASSQALEKPAASGQTMKASTTRPGSSGQAPAMECKAASTAYQEKAGTMMAM
ncbi:hypothetical protein WJX73_005154 [Symbiochloris irregularis]|uniref:Uncharacterized protein n=1 Tax=Symbiochloris irregularis TaxID=706552 RepID=A0AAW1PVX5_9CHLO